MLLGVNICWAVRSRFPLRARTYGPQPATNGWLVRTDTGSTGQLALSVTYAMLHRLHDRTRDAAHTYGPIPPAHRLNVRTSMYYLWYEECGCSYAPDYMYIIYIYIYLPSWPVFLECDDWRRRVTAVHFIASFTRQLCCIGLHKMGVTWLWIRLSIIHHVHLPSGYDTCIKVLTPPPI